GDRCVGATFMVVRIDVIDTPIFHVRQCGDDDDVPYATVTAMYRWTTRRAPNKRCPYTMDVNMDAVAHHWHPPWAIREWSTCHSKSVFDSRLLSRYYST